MIGSKAKPVEYRKRNCSWWICGSDVQTILPGNVSLPFRIQETEWSTHWSLKESRTNLTACFGFLAEIVKILFENEIFNSKQWQRSRGQSGEPSGRFAGATTEIRWSKTPSNQVVSANSDPLRNPSCSYLSLTETTRAGKRILNRQDVVHGVCPATFAMRRFYVNSEIYFSRDLNNLVRSFFWRFWSVIYLWAGIFFPMSGHTVSPQICSRHMQLDA